MGIGLGDNLFCIGFKKDQILIWSLVFGFSQCEQKCIVVHFIMTLVNDFLSLESVIYQSFPFAWLELTFQST
jgi:hypothetical protein